MLSSSQRQQQLLVLVQLLEMLLAQKLALGDIMLATPFQRGGASASFLLGSPIPGPQNPSPLVSPYDITWGIKIETGSNLGKGKPGGRDSGAPELRVPKKSEEIKWGPKTVQNRNWGPRRSPEEIKMGPQNRPHSKLGIPKNSEELKWGPKSSPKPPQNRPPTPHPSFPHLSPLSPQNAECGSRWIIQ